MEVIMFLVKDAKNLGKSIVYQYGYSNLSFELWMILHKQNHIASVSSVKNYLAHINNSYGEQFPSLRKYKPQRTICCLIGSRSVLFNI